MVLAAGELKLPWFSSAAAAAKTKVFCIKHEIYDFKSALLQQPGSL